MPIFSWKHPIEVAKTGQLVLSAAPDHLEDRAGLYFFSRRFGAGPYQPFYIGETLQVKTRLSQYIASNGKHENRIRNVLEGGFDEHSQLQIPHGSRFFHFGYLTATQGLPKKSAIERAERALIQHYLILGYELINNHHNSPSAVKTYEMEGNLYSNLIPKKLISH